MKEKVLIEDFSDEELKEENDERVNGLVEEVVCDDKKEEEGFFLKKDFSSYELRDHLLDITGQGGWVSNEILFDQLRELIK